MPTNLFLMQLIVQAMQHLCLLPENFQALFRCSLLLPGCITTLCLRKLTRTIFFTIGLGGRMKLTNRMSANAEYNIVPAGQINSYTHYNSLSAGVDIETGGHVFQLHITNSQGMIEPLFLGKTTGGWGKGNIFFGFNISRIFTLKK